MMDYDWFMDLANEKMDRFRFNSKTNIFGLEFIFFKIFLDRFIYLSLLIDINP